MPHVNNVNYSENKFALLFLNTTESINFGLRSYFIAWLFSEQCAPCGVNDKKNSYKNSK